MATVTTQDEFRAALTALEPEIILVNNISLTNTANITYTVTIKGQNSGISLFWGNPGASRRNMLVVTGELTLESIILDAEGRDGTLVWLNGGTLIMSDGVILRNVTSTTAQSAVKIAEITSYAGGNFIMNGGLITGVSAADAVLNCGGSVTMNNNAEISNNSARGVNVLKPSGGGSRGTFIMTGNAKVTGNRANQAVGGVAITESDMIMGINDGDAPLISGNHSIEGQHTGGIYLSWGSVLTMDYSAKISENHCGDYGGGVSAGSSAIIMRGDSSISDNICGGDTGGGVILYNGSTLTMEGNAQISGNECTELGGGVYVSSQCTLNLTGSAYIFDNKAQRGRGIYNEGTVNVSQSVIVQDGIYFGDANVPVINAQHTSKAQIQLEQSPHVTPENVPVVIANKHADYDFLSETDRTPWLIPEEFGDGYEVILNETLDQVLIYHKTYHICYCWLCGASNPNPDTYSIFSNFPIVLQNPGPRQGYIFKGWYDCDGNKVTSIPYGTTGDLCFIACWEKVYKKPVRLCFSGNAPCARGIPAPINTVEGALVTIPPNRPVSECCCFLGWNTTPCGQGKTYQPNETIKMKDKDITLFAMWLPTCHNCCGNGENCTSIVRI